ncbi:hypothetical protein [Dendronalium sp. ChiSLP03b]|uniref:hypothetical protein n=1 Tax=Dendronalium sp. ChiSLP03b TaxID=3075381 RepID=UPI002AD24576|nr:hypothetical protein [Dendronalium sp. ChiSLP03b]MDZ8207104.1 hypothetical protein [Dendronalium sp. ChiSLP03b]
MNKNSQLSTQTDSDREPVSFLVIGSRQTVINTVHTLYRMGFAEISEWSPLLPASEPGKVMKILTRSVSTD